MKNIIIGPAGGNVCCHCGFEVVGRADNCPLGCSSMNGNLYDMPPGELGAPCFPQMCCPCPDMDDDRKLSLVLSATGGCSYTETIILTKTAGLTLCQANPRIGNHGGQQCYMNPVVDPENAGQKGKDIVYEKYGKEDHVFAAAGDCAGSKADISLCCCDGTFLGTNPIVGVKGACHTCNYALTIEWKIINPDAVGSAKYCNCPEETFMPPVDYPNLPGDSVIDNDWVFNSFGLVSSTCKDDGADPETVFFLSFQSSNNLYWNCGPCLGGIEDGVDNDVQIHAVLTEV
tara:strand:+ start:475 stop:1335 length:861 start_codon:yes stop_codon:yes gene_type:complete